MLHVASLLDLLERSPHFVSCAFDESLNTCYRNAIYPVYKANRELPDANLEYQLDQCQRVTALLASSELAITTLVAVAAGTPGPEHRLDAEAAARSALMYGAPSLAGLLTRLEQDRRALASLARTLDERSGEAVQTAWGELTVRETVVLHAIEEPARCAQALEERLAFLDTMEPATEADATA